MTNQMILLPTKTLLEALTEQITLITEGRDFYKAEYYRLVEAVENVFNRLGLTQPKLPEAVNLVEIIGAYCDYLLAHIATLEAAQNAADMGLPLNE